MSLSGHNTTVGLVYDSSSHDNCSMGHTTCSGHIQMRSAWPQWVTMVLLRPSQSSIMYTQLSQPDLVSPSQTQLLSHGKTLEIDTINIVLLARIQLGLPEKGLFIDI